MENGSSKKVISSFIYKAFMILLKIFYPSEKILIL